MCFRYDFTKIIYVKTVATPEGPKSENRNQMELKIASWGGMEANGSLPSVQCIPNRPRIQNIQISQILMQPSVNQP